MATLDINKRTKWKWFFICSTIAVCVLIFLFSAQVGTQSLQVSEGVTINVLKWFPGINQQNEEAIVFIAKNLSLLVRKSAHFFIYFLLGITSFMAAYLHVSHKKKGIAISFLFCLCYAISDETHQFFVPGRAARITDVAIDSMGALAGILLVILLLYLYQKYKKRNQRV